MVLGLQESSQIKPWMSHFWPRLKTWTWAWQLWILEDTWLFKVLNPTECWRVATKTNQKWHELGFIQHPQYLFSIICICNNTFYLILHKKRKRKYLEWNVMEEISTKSLLYMCAILHIFQNCFERFSSNKQTILYNKNTLTISL